MTLAYAGSPLPAQSFRGASVGSSVGTPRRFRLAHSARSPRAAMDLIPGVPPGEDARNNAPLRYYVPRPKEDYSERGFATLLPETWSGETGTIGVADIDQSITKESIEAAKILPEDSASKGALGDYARMMAEDRAAALAKFDTPVDNPGRATCGESEGKKYVSET